MTRDPSKATRETLVALCEAAVAWHEQCLHPTREPDVDSWRAALAAYRAETNPALRTRAEVDAQIALEVRRSVTGLPCDDCLCPEAGDDNTRAERIRRLCIEPLAPDPTDTGACPPECPECPQQPYGSGSDSAPPSALPARATFSGPRPTPATKESSDTAGVDAGATYEETEACSCEESEALKRAISELVRTNNVQSDKLQECRRLLRFVFERAKEIRQALETVP